MTYAKSTAPLPPRSPLARAIDPERLGCAILLSSAARDWDNSSGSSSSGNGGGHKSPLQRGGGTAGTEQGSRHRFSQQKSFAETEASVGVESLPRGGVSANLYVHGDRYRHESQATYRQASLLGVQLMFEALNAIGVHPGRIHHWDLCDGTDADVDVAADIQDLLSHLPSNIPDALIYYCGPATAEGHWSLTWRCPEGHLRRIIVEPDDPLGLPEFNLLPPPEVSVVGSRIFVTDAPFTARNWVKPALRQRGIAGLEGAGLASTERGPALTRWVVGEFAVPPRGVVAFVDAPPDVGLQRLPAFNTLFWAGLPSNLDDVERLIWELEEFLGAATQHERRLAANLELFSHGGAALMLVYLASFGSAASDNLLLHILWLLHSFLMSTPLERWAGAMDEVLEAVLELPNSCGSRHIQPNQGQQQDQQMHAFQGLQQQQILSQQSDGGVRGESDATSRHSNCSPSVLRSCLTLATACIARCSHCQERCGGDLQPKVLSSIMRALGGDAGPKFVDAAAAAAGCRLASQLAHQVTLDFEHHSQLVASLQLVLCRDPRFDEVSGDYDDDKFKAEEDLTAAGAEALFYACIRSNAMKLKVLKLLGTSGRLQLLLNLRGEAAVAKLLALLRTIAAAEPPESVSEAFNETIAVEIVEAVNRFSEEAAVQRWGLAALGALVNQDRNFGRAVEAGISDCVLSSLESSYEGSELAAMQEALFCAYALLHSGVGNLGGRPELATLTGQALRCSLRTTMTVGSECTAWSLKVLQMLACKAGGQAMVEPFLPDIVEAMLSGSITFNACEAACATISFLVAGSVRITASLRPIKSRLVRAVQLLSWAFVEAEGSDCRKVKSLQAKPGRHLFSLAGKMTAGEELALHICTFLAWTGSVALGTWFICKNYLSSKKSGGSASDDYFAGGRALKWYVCAGSLMLTNLSTEQLVGLNGSVFADGCLAGIWWEAGAAIAMVVTATVFLPKYFALGLTTTSGFLGERFDLTLRTMVSVIFLFFYAVVLCPLVLYTGALAIREIFDLTVPLWTVSSAIGALGAAYALFGGLKAVAVSDCLNGLGLIVAGLWVPVAACQALPGGIFSLFEDSATYLRPLVSVSPTFQESSVPGVLEAREWKAPSVPWHTTLTGLALTNLYYWSTNQVIVQRVLAAESLSNGQKGVLFAAMMKVVGFTFLCAPGIIAIVLVQKQAVINGEVFTVAKSDEVYPRLVKAVMPTWSLGFFSAVLLGSVLSSFNSALNSAATIFALEVYKIYIDKTASDQKVVKAGTVFGVTLTLASFVIAPQLVHVGGIFTFLQRMNSIVSLPIVTVFFVGILASLPDAFAAKVGFAVAVIVGIAGQFIPDLHFLHLFFSCFVLAALSMALVTYVPALRLFLRKSPRPEPYRCEGTGVVDMTPWKPMYFISACVLGLLTLLIVSLQLASFWLFLVFAGTWAVVLSVLLAVKPTVAAQGATTAAAAAAATAREEDGEAPSSPLSPAKRRSFGTAGAGSSSRSRSRSGGLESKSDADLAEEAMRQTSLSDLAAAHNAAAQNAAATV